MRGLKAGTAETAGLGMPSADNVRGELTRLLASPHLQASERRRAFLRFIVEETLAGRADSLKGYTIATAVFGRGENFDPQTDPVVRLEARRLRRDLDGYYVDAGSRDALRISIPKGGYIPSFDWQAAAAAPQETGGRAPPPSPAVPPAPDLPEPSGDVIVRFGRAHPRALLYVALVAVSVALAVIAWSFLTDRPASGPAAGTGEPAVVVLPFKALGAGDDNRYLADGLSQELVADLMGFPGFRVHTLPRSAPEGAGTAPAAEPTALGRDLGVAYVVDGSVRIEAAEVRVAITVFDAATGRVLWTGSYIRPLTAQALTRAQSTLAGDIATALGQPYGVVQSDLEQRAADVAAADLQSYICVLRAYSYRRSFLRSELGPVQGCLEQAVQRDPDYSAAWAMLAWIRLDTGRLQLADSEMAYAEALSAANRAVALEPDSILALKALATIYHYLGRYAESEATSRHAIALNPNDPEAIAQLGWRLAIRGRFDEGVPLLERAIARSGNPPGWYHHFIAVDLYLKGDYARSREAAQRAAGDEVFFSQWLIAAASAALGDQAAAQAALQKMSARDHLAKDPAGFLRRHGATEDIVEALMAGLRKAGWTAGSA